MRAGDVAPMTLGMNLPSLNYWTSAPLFVDAMKNASDGWLVQKANPATWSISGVALPPMDADGYPVGLGSLPSEGYYLSTDAFLGNGQHYPVGAYSLIFDGDGTVVVNQGGGHVTTVDQSGRAGLPHPVNIVSSPLGIVVSITRSDPADHVRNIRLIMPGFLNTYQSQPFNPAYLAGLQSSNTLRFMDAMATNGQAIQHWAARTTADYRTQTASGGLAVEYMVELANTLHENLWVNMPALAQDDYVQGFAQYVKDNLDPGLQVNVEYGNEDWNAGFSSGYKYIDTFANSRGLTHDQATADLATHDWDVWRQVFGDQDSRVERVVANQFVNPSHLAAEISRLVATSDPTDPDHGFEIISGAPYFAPNSSVYTAATTTQDIVADSLAATTALGTQLDQFLAVRSSWEKTLGRDIPVIMYEGGWGLTASPSAPWYQAYLGVQTDPGMYQVTQAYLNTLSSHGVDGLLYYSYAGPPGPYGEWGSMAYLGQPTSQTPKFDALQDYASSVPPAISDVTVTDRSASGATISWTTSEPSSSQVEYGLGTAYGSASPPDPTPVTLHSVRLTGLPTDTLYHFQVTSARATGPAVSSSDSSFSTDVRPPVLVAVAPTHIQATSVTISWTTDKPTNGRVDYEAVGEMIRSVTDPVLSSSHSITLPNLAPGTAYRYTVTSTDAAGNSSSSGSLSGTTAAAAVDDPLAGSRLTPVGSSPTAGTPGVVAVQGTYAYVAGATSPFNLQVFDIGVGGAPALRSTVATGSSYPTAIAVAGQYAYISAFNAGLLIYDVSNPSAPRLVSRTVVGTHPYGLAIRGQYAYVTHFDYNASNSTLAIYDVSQPARPSLVGSMPIAIASKSLVVAGPYAYITGDGMLNFQVVDVSDPARPVAAGSLGVNGYYQKSVAVAGDYAFVAYSYSGGGLQVFDVSDPNKPVSVAKLATGSNPLSVQVDGHLLYLIGDTTEVFDVSSPGTPTLVATYAARGAGSALAGRDLVTIDPVAQALDLSDLGDYGVVTTAAAAVDDPLAGSRLTPVGSSPTAGTPGVVAVQGTYAYVAGATSPFNLQVFDIGVGGAPALRSTVATGSSYPTAIAVAGQYAYISAFNAGLLIYDVSNPSAPRLVSRTVVGTHPYGLAIRGQYAYVTHFDYNASNSTLAIYDVSQPARPSLVGSMPIAIASKSLVVAGPYAYITGDGMLNFQVVDVSDPARPVAAGSLGVNGYYQKSVAVAGDYAFVAYSYSGGGLQVFDVSDPNKPVSVAKLATGSNPLSVQVDGHLLYLIGDTTEVFDVSSPGTPTLVATYAARGAGSALAGRDLVTIDPVAQALDLSDLGDYGIESVVTDPAKARLFAIDATGSHVLVFATNSDGTPAASPTYVLGLDTPGTTVSQTSIGRASGLMYDAATGRLFVADSGNNRVLVFDASHLASGMAASLVLGQSGFATSAAAATSSGLSDPAGLAYDAATGRLFVADSGNNRVLVFDASHLASGMAASLVLGQSGFATSAAAATSSGLSDPAGLAYDAATGRLFVADSGNNRVLVFDASHLASGMAASLVLGQSDFIDDAPGSATNSLNNPSSLVVDSAGGRLFVLDRNNDRVVIFSISDLSSGMAAYDVLGAPASPGFAGLNLNDLTGLAYDPTSNRLLVAADGTVRVIAAPLQASDVQVVTAEAGTATIRWTTDAAAGSQVEYGPTLAYETTSPLLSAPTRAHSVILTGLQSGVTYHFRVLSRDSNGDLDASVDFTFTMP